MAGPGRPGPGKASPGRPGLAQAGHFFARVIRRLMKDLRRQMDAPTTIYEDNQGAKFHNRTKHIDICHHFVRERVVSNEIRVIYCPTEDMIADIMTNGLAKLTFEKLRDLLAMRDIM